MSKNAYDAPRFRELLQAANDSARLFRTVFVSFVIIVLYFLVIALSASDELLFKDGNLQAPILNISVRTSHYFVAAPWMLLLLHFNLLMQAVFLGRKIDDYRRALPSTIGTSQRQEMLKLLLPVTLTQLPIGPASGVPTWLLRLFVFVSLAFLPFVTLGVIQMQFLDFQNSRITAMHSAIVLLDFVLLWNLWPKVGRLCDYRQNSRPWLALLSTVSTLLVFFALGFFLPRTLLDNGDTNRVYFIMRDAPSGQRAEGWVFDVVDWLRSLHSLDVQNRRLYLSSEEIVPFDACKDRTLALNLARRSFRNALVSGSILCNAVLTDANLRGADMSLVQMQGADLQRADLQWSVLETTQLPGANLEGAQLQNADLSGARLHGANLVEAQLQNAELFGAQLQGANLVRARLQGAQLTSAALHGARLSDAQMHWTDLSGARLTGATLASTVLWNADLERAQLQAAFLWNTELHDATLEDAQFPGAWSVPSGPIVPILDFEVSIREGVKRADDLGSVVLSGELAPEDVQAAVSEMGSHFVVTSIRMTNLTSRWVLARVRQFPDTDAIHANTERMRRRVGEPTVRGTPERISALGAVGGTYSKEEAEQWILDYEQDICEAFRFDLQFLIREDLASRVRIPETTIQRWNREQRCPQDGPQLNSLTGRHLSR